MLRALVSELEEEETMYEQMELDEMPLAHKQQFSRNELNDIAIVYNYYVLFLAPFSGLFLCKYISTVWEQRVAHF